MLLTMKSSTFLLCLRAVRTAVIMRSAKRSPRSLWLPKVLHFYNTAIVKLDPVRCPPGTTAEQARARDCWPAPEVSTGTRAPLRLMGDLGLTSEQEAALVAYLKSLTDTETVKAPSHPHSPWFRPGKHWHSNASGRARSSD